MPPSDTIPSHFADPARADAAQVRSQAGLVAANGQLGGFLDEVPDLVMVLNKHRQVVYANQRLVELLGSEDYEGLLGKRPGEVLGCAHATEMPGGCGTTETCRHCGAVLAILTSLDGERAVRECRLTVCGEGGTHESLDLQIWATPAMVEGERFSFVAVSDLSDRKRRRALERIFFHDILNTAGGLKGFASLLQQSDREDLPMLAESMLLAAEQLVQEIQAQRDLLAAEHNDLKVSPALIQAHDFARGLVRRHAAIREAKDRQLVLIPPALDVTFNSDHVVLGRVLGNMIKNALEATPPGGTVSLSFEPLDADHLRFWVHNGTVMPPEVQKQVFKRSFSTKGGGRGLGTYSMNLLSERYLGGEVSFTSSPEEGTTFSLRIPKTLPS